MSLCSSVGIARTAASSLRATTQQGIVVFLDLEVKDALDWRMKIDENQERIVIVRKIKQTGSEAVETPKKHAKMKLTTAIVSGVVGSPLGKPLEASLQQQ